MKSSSVNQKGIPFLATVKPVYPLANLLSVKNTTTCEYAATTSFLKFCEEAIIANFKIYVGLRQL